ncbi:MAG: ABC transporter permease, partial [Saprospiraceae bacterium]|nr:ABC transporter permease [Saprospiraceae bacterium]
MFKNYLKLAFRNLRKNSLYAVLNIGGLAVGLAGSVLVLVWVSWEWSFNRFHSNLDKIHVMMQNQTQGGVTYTFSAMPGPLAAGLRTDFPEIEYAARGSWVDQYLVS